MEDGEDLRQGSSTLFAVFLFSILSLFLIPYTLYRLCSGGEDGSEDVKPWEEVGNLTQKPCYVAGLWTELYVSTFAAPATFSH